MTYVCNSSCVFCYNPSRENKINYKKIDKIVKAVACSHIPHVYLIGGEPSLLKTEKLKEYKEKQAELNKETAVKGRKANVFKKTPFNTVLQASIL